MFGSIPRSALTIALTIRGGEGYAVCRNAKGREVGRFAVSIVDAKFPTYENLLPGEDSHKNLTNELHLNPEYMVRAAKVFPEGMTLRYQDNLSPLAFNSISGGEMDPTVIVMPIRAE